MIPYSPLQRLWFLIDSKTKDLQKYALRPDASEKYIKKQNLEIEELTKIYNDFDQTSMFESWLPIFTETSNLIQKDSELSGVNIIVRVKRTGNHFGKLDCNLVNHGI